MIDEEVEKFLEHHGVRGMKWGQRRAINRQLNKESRRKDREAHARTVQKARDKIESGKLNKEWFDAKKQFKINKEKLGSREARKILNKTKQKHWNDVATAQQAKNGKEAAASMLVVAGLVAVSALAKRA